MPSSSTRRRRPPGIKESIRQMPAALRTYSVDWPLANSLWQRYRHRGDAAAFDPLYLCLMPYVVAQAAKLKRFNKLFEHDAVDELISDGSISLLYCLRRTEDQTLRQFCYQLGLSVRFEMRRGVYNRRFAGTSAFRRDSIIGEQRARLTQELGQEPSRQELTDSLRSVLNNPQIQIGETPSRYSLDTDEDARVSVADLAANDPGPMQPLIDAEVMHLAKKSLKGIDRRIFDLAIRGYGAKEIAHRLKLGVSQVTTNKRINGVLWLVRSNAKLAKYLGTEPAQLPAGKFYQWPAVASFQELRLPQRRMAI